MTTLSGKPQSRTILTLIILTASAILPAVSTGQSGSPIDWNFPGFDSHNTNYDPQNAINSQNVQDLQVKWIYQVPVNPFDIPGAAPSLGIETTPLVVHGIAYVATPYDRVIALLASSGKVLWSYQVNMTKFLSDSWWSYAYTVSSISYYNGVVYLTAADTSVYAFDALNGTVRFVIPNTGADIPGNTGTYFGEKAPVLYKNLLIVRASTTDYGGRGYVRAYDIDSQKLVWSWYSVPEAGGDPNWDNQSSLGNINAYAGDWGSSNLIGGGAAWGLIAVDDRTGTLYFSTGHPSGGYDASQRPGPNLYADSVIALDANSGHMLWYYQINAHDIAEHEGGWSISLANITLGGQQKEVVIQTAKNNFVYVLDAKTGMPVYDPIYVGSPQSNVPNDNAGNSADMTASQSQIVGTTICPGTDGGIEMSPAIHGSNLFVASQNACAQMLQGKVFYKGQTINGYIYEGNPATSQNSTLYSIDLSTGKIDWKFLMADTYQGSSAVVSGGVVYAVDRIGTLYALNEKTGTVLRSINLGGLGAAGISIALDDQGNPMVFVPAGGGDLPSSTPGVVLGLYIPSQAVQSSTSYLGEVPTLALAAVVIVLGAYILVSRSRRRQKAAST